MCPSDAIAAPEHARNLRPTRYEIVTRNNDPGLSRGCSLGSSRRGGDYGTRLYFVDRSAKPEWSAGRYRPGIHELDCIGLIITHYTSGEVAFHFGGFFKQNHYRFKAGDYVGITVNNAGTGIIRVKYDDPNGVPPA